MKGRIAEIASQWGMQDKQGGGQYGPAMKVHLKLETGEEARWVTLFEQKNVGDELELVQKESNGKLYWNAVSQKQAAEVEFKKVVIALLKDIRARLARLEGEPEQDTTPAPKAVPAAPVKATGPAIMRQAMEKVKAQLAESGMEDVDIDTPVNLDDIPF